MRNKCCIKWLEILQPTSQQNKERPHTHTHTHTHTHWTETREVLSFEDHNERMVEVQTVTIVLTETVKLFKCCFICFSCSPVPVLLNDL